MGNILAEPVFREQVILFAELDRRAIARQHNLDVVGHYARPDIFRLHVDTQPQTPVIRQSGELQGYPIGRLEHPMRWSVMLGLTALELARIQFGFAISFHRRSGDTTCVASYLAVLEGFGSGRKIPSTGGSLSLLVGHFAVNFAMGVVSGLVMAYQFGTNWSYFSAFAGSITGPLLTYEVLTAFFLEAGFLGAMLFSGWNKVGPGLHFLCDIGGGAWHTISATWILASNSWMQTPQGFTIIDGRVVPTDWFEVIFNPSFPIASPTTVAAYLATASFR